jgi:hypothetical protein
MPNRQVNLTKRVQTPQGMRYCAVVLSANGRVKPDLVLAMVVETAGVGATTLAEPSGRTQAVVLQRHRPVLQRHRPLATLPAQT